MDISKLCLGTAQMGMTYGIKNELGRQPSQEESFVLLEEALKAGIDTFDTASAYGEAEKILGEFGISKYPVKIISKLSFSEEERLKKDRIGIIEKKLYQSLKNLRMSSLDGYLLHTAADYDNELIMQTLKRFKENKLIHQIGVSIYDTADAVQIARDGIVDCIQIPFNVFDRRLEKTEFFSLTRKNNMKIFARSAFLQGLLLMEIDDIPPYLDEAKSYLRSFIEIADRYGFTRMEAAFLFSCSQAGIDQVVFGVETVAQLHNNIRTISKCNAFGACGNDLRTKFMNICDEIILPNLWKTGV